MAYVSACVSASQPASRSCSINDTTCLGLVEIKCLSLVLRQFDDGGALRCGCRYYLGLKFGKALLKLLPFVCELLFGFRGQC